MSEQPTLGLSLQLAQMEAKLDKHREKMAAVLDESARLVVISKRCIRSEQREYRTKVKIEKRAKKIEDMVRKFIEERKGVACVGSTSGDSLCGECSACHGRGSAILLEKALDDALR